MNPLAWPLAALIAGILAAPLLEERSVWFALPAAATLGWLRPKLLVIAVFLAGAASKSIADAPRERLGDDGYPARVVARIARAPEQTARGFTMRLDLESANGSPVSGGAMVDYFPETEDLRALFEEQRLGSGDHIEILVRLRPPSTFRNPEGFNYRRHLERRGVFWTGTLRNPRLVRVLDRGHHLPGALRNAFAARIASRVRGGPEPEALALGMVLGLDNRLEPGTEDRFERAGLIHLLVVSGFNLAVVAGAALWIGRRLSWGRYRRSFRLVFAQVVVLAYAVLVEGDAPVLRATIMASLLILGTLIDRGYRIVTALVTSVFVILLFDPASIEEAGFQMTVVAVLAIDRLAAPLIRWVREHAGRSSGALLGIDDDALDSGLPPRAVDWRVVQRLRAERSGLPSWIHAMGSRIRWSSFDVLVVTAAIQLALLPLTVELYHRISFVALPLNVAGAMTASIVTPLGLVVALLPGPFAAGPATAVGWTLRALIASVDIGLALPGAVRMVPSPPLGIWIIFGALLAALQWFAGKRQPGWATTTGAGALLAAGVVVGGDFAPPPPAYTTLTFLDVGQGDATFIELSDGRRILVDGGGLVTGPDLADRSEETSGRFRIGQDVVVPFLLSQGIRKLDVVALSHAHQDHMDGLVDVLATMRVGELWLGRNPATGEYVNLLETASRAAVPVRWLRAGDTVGNFRVLHPPADHRTGPIPSNDDSLVLLLETPTGSVLLPGDIETDLPDPPGRATVLKVPHHGSRNAAHNLTGNLPVISVGGRNPFGHPHPSRLPALRTDTLGAIRIVLTPEGPSASFPGL